MDKRMGSILTESYNNFYPKESLSSICNKHINAILGICLPTLVIQISPFIFFHSISLILYMIKYKLVARRNSK